MQGLGWSSSWKDVVQAAGAETILTLSQKTVIITGCNTGIGKETATAIASLNANVIFGCRNTEKAAAAAAEIVALYPQAKITCIALDLSVQDSVRSFCIYFERLTSENGWPPLSVVILNAGIVAMGHNLKDGIESTFATNHLGGFLLTNLLLPRLRSAQEVLNEPSRVVVVSSDSHYGPLVTKNVDSESLKEKIVYTTSKEFSFMKAYGSSKLANVQFAQRLHRAESPNVIACSLHPGSMIATDIARDSGVLNFAMKYIISPFTKSIPQGAATTVMCTIDQADRLQGKYFCDCQEKKASSLALDGPAQDALWEVSKGLCRL
jgi:NAD(P)-dependent dehydrogenase (short-subunit alcohol dehydrogenase family)